MNSELHAFILWEYARNKSKEIIDDLETRFEICQIYEISWPKTKFAKNLKRFYGVTLANPIQKESQCGNGPFLLIIIRDNNPKHGKRKTSLGSQIVNTNVYDLKMQYRRMLKSGFIIHSSIHEKESNHDFTLLLGKTLAQLKEELKNPWDGKIINLKTEMIGETWNSPQEVFFVMNSIINYVILRNFENFPEELISHEHKDIDLLTDDQWQIPYVLNMEKINSNSIGFSPFVKISEKKIKLDIRYVNDGYYDEKWSKDILDRKILSNGVFVPSDEDYFFSLLYHMIIHKKKLRNDYCERLYKIAPQYIKEKYSQNDFNNYIILKKILEEFMKINGYQYVNSIRYSLKHNEPMRLLRVGLFTIKHEGWNFLFRAIKLKMSKTIKKK